MPVLTKINTNSIAEDAITGDKFAGDAYLSNTANQNISGTYSENRLYTSDAYTLSGNATINSHLTLSSVKPTADVVLTASGAYTLTGTGVLSAGSLLAKERTDLTGMTGELGSTVTGTPAITGLGTVTSGTLGSGVSFPSGHITNVFRFTHTTGVYYTEATSFSIAQNPFSFSAVSGRYYIIAGTAYTSQYRSGGATRHDRYMIVRTYYGTTSRSQGDTTLDTKINQFAIGRELIAGHDDNAPSYQAYSYNAYFTAGSTARHYVYQVIQSPHTAIRSRLHADTESPHLCVIYEVMP